MDWPQDVQFQFLNGQESFPSDCWLGMIFNYRGRQDCGFFFLPVPQTKGVDSYVKMAKGELNHIL